MKTTSILFLIELFLSNFMFSQDRIFISPGIKLGYGFGENGGFIYGMELSVVHHSDNNKQPNIYGFLVSVDNLKGLKKIHIGFENTINDNDKKFLNGLGFEIGPTVVWEKDDVYFGFGITMYHGFIIHPYYTFNYIPKRANLHELGTYLKFPFMVRGEPIRIGG